MSDVCTATLADGDREPLRCTLPAGHPDNHVGPELGPEGSTCWYDQAIGATPHKESSSADRHTVDTIDSDALDALYDRLERASHAVRENYRACESLLERLETETRAKHRAIAACDMADEGMEAARNRAEQAEAELERMRDLLRSENDRANKAIERELILEGEIEAQRAVIARARRFALRWATLRTHDSAELNGTEQPTT
ncbi:hypothetical protein ACWDA7_19455 [Streptomyces sp. NPDC001156]